MNQPSFLCRLHLASYDQLSGGRIWQASYDNFPVGILEQKRFRGFWSNSSQAGIIDMETGANRVLHESKRTLGWPVLDGPGLAIPWRERGRIGVDWIDGQVRKVREAAWRATGVRNVTLWRTESGLALQSSEQTLWWLGLTDSPLWHVRAKPWIYHVYHAPESSVFIGTDGRGGRLFALDADSGREILNLKPAYGGVGDLSKIPNHPALVSGYGSGRLLVISMVDCHHDFSRECWKLEGTCNYGAICRIGKNGKKLAIVDIRSETD